MPNTKLRERILELPLFQGMSRNDLEQVITSTKFRQFNMSKENFIKEISEDRLSNRWWMNQTRFTMKYGFDEATDEAGLIESVTREDVRNLAEKILSQPNFIELVMIPAAAAEAAAPETSEAEALPQAA